MNTVEIMDQSNILGDPQYQLLVDMEGNHIEEEYQTVS